MMTTYVFQRYAVSLFLCAALAACGSSMPTDGGTTTPVATNPGPSNPNSTNGTPSTCSSSDTWSSYASGFFDSNCAPCHGAGKAPGTRFFDPSSYSSIAGADANITQQISAGTMPKNASLKDADKARILTWLSCSPPPQ